MHKKQLLYTGYFLLLAAAGCVTFYYHPYSILYGLSYTISNHLSDVVELLAIPVFLLTTRVGVSPANVTNIQNSITNTAILPFSTVSNVGFAQTGLTNNGATFGPDSTNKGAPTTTTGIFEGMLSATPLWLELGNFNIQTTLAIPSKADLIIWGSGRSVTTIQTTSNFSGQDGQGHTTMIGTDQQTDTTDFDIRDIDWLNTANVTLYAVADFSAQEGSRYWICYRCAFKGGGKNANVITQAVLIMNGNEDAHLLEVNISNAGALAVWSGLAWDAFAGNIYMEQCSNNVGAFLCFQVCTIIHGSYQGNFIIQHITANGNSGPSHPNQPNDGQIVKPQLELNIIGFEENGNTSTFSWSNQLANLSGATTHTVAASVIGCRFDKTPPVNLTYFVFDCQGNTKQLWSLSFTSSTIHSPVAAAGTTNLIDTTAGNVHTITGGLGGIGVLAQGGTINLNAPTTNGLGVTTVLLQDTPAAQNGTYTTAVVSPITSVGEWEAEINIWLNITAIVTGNMTVTVTFTPLGATQTTDTVLLDSAAGVASNNPASISRWKKVWGARCAANTTVSVTYTFAGGGSVTFTPRTTFKQTA